MDFNEHEVETVRRLISDCAELASEYSIEADPEQVKALAEKVGYKLSQTQIEWLDKNEGLENE